jgi:GAF domain-containing protein
MLDGVIMATGADMGNVQLLDQTSGSLYIHTQRGFGRRFLEFFERVSDASESACGAAAASTRRVVVPDVFRSPMFENVAALEVLLAADVRAVQSTPLMSSSGELVGVLSTHYAEPRELSEDDRRILDMVAANTAFWTSLARPLGSAGLRS